MGIVQEWSPKQRTINQNYDEVEGEDPTPSPRATQGGGDEAFVSDAPVVGVRVGPLIHRRQEANLPGQPAILVAVVLVVPLKQPLSGQSGANGIAWVPALQIMAPQLLRTISTKMNVLCF